MKSKAIYPILFVFLLIYCYSFGQNKPEIILPVGHTSRTSSMKYSADGKYLLSNGYDNTVIIWDAVRGHLHYQLKSPDYLINSGDFLGNGERFFIRCSDRKVRIYETKSLNLLVEIVTITGLCPPIASAGGKYLAGLNKYGYVTLWNTFTGKKEISFNKFHKHKSYIRLSESCSSDPEGIQYICIYYRTSPGMMVFDVYSGKTVYQSNTEHPYYGSVFNTDKGFIITEDQVNKKYPSLTYPPGKLFIRDIENPDNYFSPGDTLKTPEYLFVSPYAPIAVIRYNDNSVEIYETDSLNSLSKLENYDASSSESRIKFHPGGRSFLLTSGNKPTCLVHAFTGEILKEYDNFPTDDDNLAFSPPTASDSIGGRYIIVSDPYANGESTTYLVNTESGDVVTKKTGKHGEFVNAVFNPQGDELVIEFEGIEVWDIKTDKLKYTLKGSTINVNKFLFRPDHPEEILLICEDTITRIIDLKTLRIKNKLIGHKDIVYDGIYSPDSKYILTGAGYKHWRNEYTPENVIKIWDASTGKFLWQLEGHSSAVISLDFNSDGTQLASLSHKGSFIIWDFKTAKTIQNGYIGDFGKSIVFHPSDTIVGTADRDGHIQLYDIISGEKINQYYLGYQKTAYSLDFSKNGELMAASGSYGILGTVKLFNLLTDSVSYIGNDYHDPNSKYSWETQPGIRSSVYTVEFNKDDTEVLTANHRSKAQVWPLLNAPPLAELNSHTAKLIQAKYSLDYANIFTLAEDNSLRVWDADSVYEKVAITLFKGDKLLAYTPDKYYFAEKDIASKIKWRINGNFYGFEQFDLIFNRPDIVLSRMGFANISLIKGYYHAYLKRLKKMGFKEEDLSGEFHIPESAIENFEYMPVIEEKDIEIDLNFNDSKYNLDRYNVWINDVPIYGMKGNSLKELENNHYSVKEKFNLSEGNNKIQVSCLNEKGAESYKETVQIKYEPKKKTIPDLYIVAVSVSEYQQSEMNLKYAVKDGRDLVNYFSSANLSYNQIHIDTFFNSTATRSNISAIKEKLMKSEVDDQVILYVSGHGLLDDNLDFYFASHDMDFNDPAKNGISYDMLEGLLDGISARKKLFLLDACHSGEVDKESEEGENTLANVSSTSYNKKGAALASSPKLGLQNTFELMQELFVNLNRGSGAQVISAAAGNSYALESDEWKNGVFTYSILSGLKEYAADQNGDKQITVSELKSYVSDQVVELTNGAQKPTSRQENVVFDFRVW